MLELLAAATMTAFATGLGAIPVALLGVRAAAIRPAMLGVASGVMGVAAWAGLLEPALEEGSAVEVWAGVVIGVAFLLLARRVLARDRASVTALARRRAASILVFTVLLVHSLPEGFAIGTAYASETEGLAAFVVLAIAIQNIPEGTSVAIPMAYAGASGRRQFWAAVASSAPQPVGAAIAYLAVEEISSLLPLSFGFAAGAMLALVLLDLLPEALSENVRQAVTGALLGTGVMLALSAALGV